MDKETGQALDHVARKVIRAYAHAYENARPAPDADDIAAALLAEGLQVTSHGDGSVTITPRCDHRGIGLPGCGTCDVRDFR